MILTRNTGQASGQAEIMKRYYSLHAKIYDATRWTFLFGRKRMVRRLSRALQTENPDILEVGCGTGYNLEQLAKHFPNARLKGVDVSEDMLRRSAKRLARWADRITLVEKPYGTEGQPEQYDLILFSYSLTMINPHWEVLLSQAQKDLKPGGLLAVVDFHDSPLPWFKRHMANNHVRMDGHLLPVLKAGFISVDSTIYRAYAGIWEYVLFLGIKAG